MGQKFRIFVLTHSRLYRRIFGFSLRFRLAHALISLPKQKISGNSKNFRPKISTQNPKNAILPKIFNVKKSFQIFWKFNLKHISSCSRIPWRKNPKILRYGRERANTNLTQNQLKSVWVNLFASVSYLKIYQKIQKYRHCLAGYWETRTLEFFFLPTEGENEPL